MNRRVKSAWVIKVLLLMILDSITSNRAKDRLKDGLKEKEYNFITGKHRKEVHKYKNISSDTVIESGKLDKKEFLNCKKSLVFIKNIPNKESITDNSTEIIISKIDDRFFALKKNQLFICSYRDICDNNEIKKEFVEGSSEAKRILIVPNNIWERERLLDRIKVAKNEREFENLSDEFEETIKYLARFSDIKTENAYYIRKSKDKSFCLEKFMKSNKKLFKTQKIMKKVLFFYKKKKYQKIVKKIEEKVREAAEVAKKYSENPAYFVSMQKINEIRELFDIFISPIRDMLEDKIEKCDKQEFIEENMEETTKIIHILVDMLKYKISNIEKIKLIIKTTEKIKDIAKLRRLILLEEEDELVEKINKIMKDILDSLYETSAYTIAEEDKDEREMKIILRDTIEEIIYGVIESYELVDLNRKPNGILTYEEYKKEYSNLIDNFVGMFIFIVKIDKKYRYRDPKEKNKTIKTGDYLLSVLPSCINEYIQEIKRSNEEVEDKPNRGVKENTNNVQPEKKISRLYSAVNSYIHRIFNIKKRRHIEEFDEKDISKEFVDWMVLGESFTRINILYTMVSSIYNHMKKMQTYHEVWDTPVFMVRKKPDENYIKDERRSAYLLYSLDKKVLCKKKIDFTQKNLNAFKNASSLKEIDKIKGTTRTTKLFLEPKHLDASTEKDKEKIRQYSYSFPKILIDKIKKNLKNNKITA